MCFIITMLKIFFKDNDVREKQSVAFFFHFCVCFIVHANNIIPTQKMLFPPSFFPSDERVFTREFQVIPTSSTSINYLNTPQTKWILSFQLKEPLYGKNDQNGFCIYKSDSYKLSAILLMCLVMKCLY